MYKTLILKVPNTLLPLINYNGAYQTDNKEWLIKLAKRTLGFTYYLECNNCFYYVPDKFFWSVFETLSRLGLDNKYETIYAEGK